MPAPVVPIVGPRTPAAFAGDINAGLAVLYLGGGGTYTLDTDVALAANSDTRIASQKAVKAYVASSGPTLPLPVASGGTASVTAGAARGALGINVEGFTGVGNVDHSIAATSRTVGTNAAFTASHTWTLPPCNSVNAGGLIVVADFLGTVTGTNTLVIARAGADTINGATSVTISSASGGYLLISDGVSKWSAQSIGASGAAAGVTTFNARNGAVAPLIGDYNSFFAGVWAVRGLVGQRHASTTTRVDMSASQAVFYNPSTGANVFVNNVASEACDIATAGPVAGGRDQAGAFSSGATVYFYFIRKDDATIDLIASTTAATTGPVLPAGYTTWVYATTLVMSGTALYSCFIRGCKVFYEARQQVLNSGTATTATAVSLSLGVPAQALSIDLSYNYNNSAAATGDYSGDLHLTSGVLYFRCVLNVYSAGGNAGVDSTISVPNVSQQVFYLVSSALTRFSLWVLGYSVRNGDS